MKFKRIVRPEIYIEYVGVKGFFVALFAICKVGLIKKCDIDYTVRLFTAQTHGIEVGVVKRRRFYTIPRYKFVRVSKLSESEE